MEMTPPPLIHYTPRTGPPHSGSLIAAAVLCFIGTLVPLGWLALQFANFQHNRVRAMFTGARLPFGLLVLEDVAGALALISLLIVAGVLLCVRARWAIHVATAVMGIVLVGATGATLADAVRRLSDVSPMAKPATEHVPEIGLRTVFGVVWPLAVVLLLNRRGARAAIVAYRGSMPTVPLLFVAGVALVWYGLATTSVHAQAAPVGVYFGRFYSDTAVTLWRAAFAAARLLAGVLLLRASMIGWLLAVLVTLAAITSEVLLASMGGTDALARESFTQTADRFRVGLAIGAEPNAPWAAALYRSATLLCLLGLLSMAFLFEDEPDRPESGTGPTDQAQPPQSGTGPTDQAQNETFVSET